MLKERIKPEDKSNKDNVKPFFNDDDTLEDRIRKIKKLQDDITKDCTPTEETMRLEFVI